MTPYCMPYPNECGRATGTRFSVVSVLVLVTEELLDRDADCVLERDAEVPERDTVLVPERREGAFVGGFIV